MQSKTSVCLFILGLRGPPLDENFLSEVGYNIVIKDVTGFFNPSGCLIPAWRQHLMQSANHNSIRTNGAGTMGGKTTAGNSLLAFVSDWFKLVVRHF